MMNVTRIMLQGPIKAEPNMDSPSVAAVEGGPGSGDPMDVDGTTEIPADKSTVLKVRRENIWLAAVFFY